MIELRTLSTHGLTIQVEDFFLEGLRSLPASAANATLSPWGYRHTAADATTLKGPDKTPTCLNKSAVFGWFYELLLSE
jgi:hypothetical protein